MTLADEIKAEFEAARQAYPGRKLGHTDEVWRFIRACMKSSAHPAAIDPKEAVKLLLPAIQRQIKDKAAQRNKTGWSPQWANMSTWINNRRWNESTPWLDGAKEVDSCCICGRPATRTVNKHNYCEQDKCRQKGEGW